MIKLIGIIIIIIGFLRKYDTIAVVLVAGIVTGLLGGLNIIEILEIIGGSFVSKRYMAIFLVTLPVIGIMERYGLRERAAALIRKRKSVTAGKVFSMYTFVRELAAAFSLRLGGHVQFIRPLISPMGLGSVENKYGELSDKDKDLIKGHAAKSENIGNFFGQNVFVASGGVLLVVATLEELGMVVTPLSVSKAAIPIAVIAFVFAVIQNCILDRRIRRKLSHIEPGAEKSTSVGKE